MVRGSWLVARRNPSNPYLTTLALLKSVIGLLRMTTNHEPPTTKEKGAQGAPFAITFSGASVFQRLDVNHELDVIAKIRGELAHAEFGPLDSAGRIRSARFFLHELIGCALESRNGERQRLGHAEQGHFAIDGGWLIASEIQLLGLERDGRVLGNVEEVFALQMFVQLGHTRADRSDVDGHVHATGLGCTIKRELPADFVESAPLRGPSEVTDLETRMGMAGVN